MATMGTAEVHIVIDENGDYAVGKDAESAAANYDTEIGGTMGELGLRRVVLTVNVPLPEPILATVNVPDPGPELAVVSVS